MTYRHVFTVGTYVLRKDTGLVFAWYPGASKEHEGLPHETLEAVSEEKLFSLLNPTWPNPPSTFEPPLTLAFVEEHVESLQKELREKLAVIPDRVSNHARRQQVVVDYQKRGDSLRSQVLYMMAWHRIEGDVVAIARALGKLAVT